MSTKLHKKLAKLYRQNISELIRLRKFKYFREIDAIRSCRLLVADRTLNMKEKETCECVKKVSRNILNNNSQFVTRVLYPY
jgi:hypothetical protein